MKQILEAVAYLHKLGIVHKNIKHENVLVNDDLTIKLADHGFHNLQNMMNNKFIESDVYLAPEVKAG